MTVTIAEQPTEEEHRGGGGLLDWLTTTNHKKIGLLYILTTLVFFLLGGIIALVMRGRSWPIRGSSSCPRACTTSCSPSTGRR